jgi:hypothetical protein
MMTSTEKWVVWSNNPRFRHFENSLESAKAYALHMMQLHHGGCKAVQQSGDVYSFFSKDKISARAEVSVEKIMNYKGKEVTASHYYYLTR